MPEEKSTADTSDSSEYPSAGTKHNDFMNHMEYYVQGYHLARNREDKSVDAVAHDLIDHFGFQSGNPSRENRIRNFGDSITKKFVTVLDRFGITVRLFDRRKQKRFIVNAQTDKVCQSFQELLHQLQMFRPDTDPGVLTMAISSGLQSFLLPKILSRTQADLQRGENPPPPPVTLFSELLRDRMAPRLLRYNTAKVQELLGESAEAPAILDMIVMWDGHASPEAFKDVPRVAGTPEDALVIDARSTHLERYAVEHTESDVSIVYHPACGIAKKLADALRTPGHADIAVLLEVPAVVGPTMRYMKTLEETVLERFQAHPACPRFLGPTTIPNILNIVRNNLAVGILPVSRWMAYELHRDHGLLSLPLSLDHRRLPMSVRFYCHRNLQGRRRAAVEKIVRCARNFFQREHEHDLNRKWDFAARTEESLGYIANTFGDQAPFTVHLHYIDPSGSGRDMAYWKTGVIERTTPGGAIRCILYNPRESKKFEILAEYSADLTHDPASGNVVFLFCLEQLFDAEGRPKTKIRRDRHATACFPSLITRPKSEDTQLTMLGVMTFTKYYEDEAQSKITGGQMEPFWMPAAGLAVLSFSHQVAPSELLAIERMAANVFFSHSMRPMVHAEP